MPPMAGSGCSSHASAAASDPKAAASVRRNSLILASPNARLVASCPHSPSNQRLGRPADSNEGGHLFQSDGGQFGVVSWAGFAVLCSNRHHQYIRGREHVIYYTVL